MQEHLPRVYNHKLRWILLALAVGAAFFLFWTMGFWGTPAKPGVGPIVVQPVQ